jgi:hypothetical protein
LFVRPKHADLLEIAKSQKRCCLLLAHDKAPFTRDYTSSCLCIIPLSEADLCIVLVFLPQLVLFVLIKHSFFRLRPPCLHVTWIYTDYYAWGAICITWFADVRIMSTLVAPQVSWVITWSSSLTSIIRERDTIIIIIINNTITFWLLLYYITIYIACAITSNIARWFLSPEGSQS